MLKPFIVVGLLLILGALHRLKTLLGAPVRYYSWLLGGLFLVLVILAFAPLFLAEAPTIRFALGVVLPG